MSNLIKASPKEVRSADYVTVNSIGVGMLVVKKDGGRFSTGKKGATIKSIYLPTTLGIVTKDSSCDAIMEDGSRASFNSIRRPTMWQRLFVTWL